MAECSRFIFGKHWKKFKIKYLGLVTNFDLNLLKINGFAYFLLLQTSLLWIQDKKITEYFIFKNLLCRPETWTDTEALITLVKWNHEEKVKKIRLVWVSTFTYIVRLVELEIIFRLNKTIIRSESIFSFHLKLFLKACDECIFHFLFPIWSSPLSIRRMVW